MESVVQKPPPPLLGFNNNVRHRGLVFHIQTEDSGVKHARIMTHLFADGGRIIDSARTDYSEHLGRSDMGQVLGRIMKEQHKAMFVRLRAGTLDEQIEAALGPLPVRPAPKAGTPAAAPTLEDLSRRAGVDADCTTGRALSNPSLRRVVPSVPPEPGELDLDMESLDRAHPLRQDPKRAQALARTIPPSSKVAQARAQALASQGGGEVHYVASRPSAIFTEVARPGTSLFGEEPISQKSLDEVILSYLAEETEDES